MSQYAVHWWRGTRTANGVVQAECGYWNTDPALWTPDRWTIQWNLVTCGLCKRTQAWRQYL